jgi:hypothetical protein
MLLFRIHLSHFCPVKLSVHYMVVFQHAFATLLSSNHLWITLLYWPKSTSFIFQIVCVLLCCLIKCVAHFVLCQVISVHTLLSVKMHESLCCLPSCLWTTEAKLHTAPWCLPDNLWTTLLTAKPHKTPCCLPNNLWTNLLTAKLHNTPCCMLNNLWTTLMTAKLHKRYLVDFLIIYGLLCWLQYVIKDTLLSA